MLPVYFRFLDSLRESGAINMWGAAPVLAEAFGLTKPQAREVTAAWMKTFNKIDPAEVRAARAVDERGGGRGSVTP